MVVPWAAKAATDSPAGTPAPVRPASRVRTTLWATPGTVSSRPAAAAAAPSELTPGTTSNSRPLAAHQSTCSWMAPNTDGSPEWRRTTAVSGPVAS